MKSLLPRAMRLLAQRDYSEQEMRRKLAALSPFDRTVEKEPISKESIDQAIEYCHQYNWLNDAEYSRKFIISRSHKGYGRQRIQSELQQKGIDRDDISRAMQKCEIDWYEKAKKVATQRFGNDIPSDWKERSKMQRYLAYRGFAQDEIQSVFTDSE